MRRLTSLVAAASLAVGLMTATITPVFADGSSAVGPCYDSTSQNYTAGENAAENTSANAFGVQATVDVASSGLFHNCSPDDNAGQNASVAFVGVKDLGSGAFFGMGILRCTNVGSMCDTSAHLFVERRGIFNWDYQFYDFGPQPNAELYGPVVLKVKFNKTNGHWEAFYNNGTGYIVSYDMGAGLDPNGSGRIKARIYAEIHDAGDGIGDLANDATDIGGFKWLNVNNSWAYVDPGTSCDWNDGLEVFCKPNGAGAYFYTTNPK